MCSESPRSQAVSHGTVDSCSTAIPRCMAVPLCDTSSLKSLGLGVAIGLLAWLGAFESKPVMLGPVTLGKTTWAQSVPGTGSEVLEGANEPSEEASLDGGPSDEPAQPSAPRNSLTPDPNDELLPRAVAPGELSPSEVEQVRLRAIQLDQEAEATYLQGQVNSAYQTWFRALRLLQYSSADEEIVALGKVGGRAWQDARAAEAQSIAQRLLLLDQITDPQTKAIETSEVLEATIKTQENLALAHEQVGALDPAVERYEWLLEKNEELKRAAAQEQIVDRLALLNLARLNYPDATQYTQRQLTLLRDRPPRQQQPQTEILLLERLAYLQEQDRDWSSAAVTQQELLGRYSEPINQAKRPALMVAIARNQAKSGEEITATQTYQDAYRAAQELQQFGVSHEALANLAGLYQKRSQSQDALTVYEILRRVDELSYNLFGLLQTYESIGRIYISQGNRVAAKQAFEQALHIAQQIRYREDKIQAQLAGL